MYCIWEWKAFRTHFAWMFVLSISSCSSVWISQVSAVCPKWLSMHVEYDGVWSIVIRISLILKHWILSGRISSAWTSNRLIRFMISVLVEMFSNEEIPEHFTGPCETHLSILLFGRISIFSIYAMMPLFVSHMASTGGESSAFKQ